MPDSEARPVMPRGWWLRWFEEMDRHRRYSLAEQIRNAAVLGVATIIAVRLILTYALDARMAVAGGVVGFVIGMALAGLSMVVFASWHARRRPGQTSGLVASLLVGTVSLAILVEAFAGFSMVLWRQDRLPAPFEPGLWDAERHYLWHLLDSIPLLRIPETLGLSDRGLFDNHLGRVLVVLFTLAVLAPLARLLVAGLRLTQTLRLIRRGRFLHRLGAPLSAGAQDWVHRHRWRDASRILLLALLAWFLLLAVDALLPGGAAGSFVAAGLLVYVCDALIVIVAVTAFAVARSGWAWPADRSSAVAAAAVRTVALIVITLSTATAALITLRWLGFAPPAGPSGGQSLAALETIVFHIVDVLPGPDLPVLLDWQPPQPVSGRLVGLVLVLARAIVLIGPFLILASAIEGYAARLAVAHEAAERAYRVTVPRSFGRDLRYLHDLLDQRDYAQTARTPVARLDSALQTLDRLRRESDRVGDALGEVPGRLAKDAVHALPHRLFALRFRPVARTEADSEAWRNACVDRINAYSDAARAVLWPAVEDATGTVRRWPGVISQAGRPDRGRTSPAVPPQSAPPGATGRQAGPASTEDAR